VLPSVSTFAPCELGTDGEGSAAEATDTPTAATIIDASTIERPPSDSPGGHDE
jgi:hypothetical protein